MTTPPFDTSRFPGGDLDPEMVDDAAVLLEVRAVQVRSQGRWVVDVWSGLRECYQAPEAGQLYAVMGPVGKLSGDFADDVGVVAEALHVLADDFRGILERRGELVAEAEEFNASAAGPAWAPWLAEASSWAAGRPQWQTSPWMVNEYDRIIGALNTLDADLREVEERCALKIRMLDDVTRLGSSAPGAFQWRGGYQPEPAPAPDERPWGPPLEFDGLDYVLNTQIVHYFQGVWVDGIWGAVTDAGAMAGFDEDGWSLETSAEAWAGIATLLGRDAQTGQWGQKDAAAAAWLEAGKSMVAWDLWADDPARAMGNVALLAIPGLGAAKGVKALRAVTETRRASRALPDVDAPRPRTPNMLDRVLDAATSDRALNIAGKIDRTLDPLGTLADYGFSKTKDLLARLELGGHETGGREIAEVHDPGSGRLPNPHDVPDADQTHPAAASPDGGHAPNDNPLPARNQDTSVNPRANDGNEGRPTWYEEYQRAKTTSQETQAARQGPSLKDQLRQDMAEHTRQRAEATAGQTNLSMKDQLRQDMAAWDAPPRGHGGADGGSGRHGPDDGTVSALKDRDRPGGGAPVRNGAHPDADTPEADGGRAHDAGSRSGGTHTDNGADDTRGRNDAGAGRADSTTGDHADTGAGIGRADATTSDIGTAGDSPEVAPHRADTDLTAHQDARPAGAVGGRPDEVVWRGGDGVELTGREKAVVDDALVAARNAEPAITASLKDLLDDHSGVRLSGLEDRVRPGGSVYWDVACNLRRVTDATADGLVAQATDILRYRMVVDPHGSGFADTAQLVVDDLARRGYRPVGVFDGWEPGSTRVGVSTRWMAPDGNMLEIQLHTPDSIRAADQLDMLDSGQRDPLLTPEQVEQARWQQAHIAATVPRPYDAGALELPELPGFRDRTPDRNDDDGWPTPSGKDLARPIPGGTGRAVHAQSADPRSLEEFVRREFPHLADVNSSRHETGQAGYLHNCTRAALAGDLSLGGKNVIAHPSAAARPITDISDALGGQWRHANDYDAVIHRMDQLGDGARGVVAIDRGDGKVGHVLNVVQSDRHGTVFLDPQTGKIANLDPSDRLYYLETAPGSNLDARFRTADTDTPGLSPLTDTERDGLLNAAGQHDPADVPVTENADADQPNGQSSHPDTNGDGADTESRADGSGPGSEPVGWTDKDSDLSLSLRDTAVVDDFAKRSGRVQSHYQKTMDDIAARHDGVELANSESLLAETTDYKKDIASQLRKNETVDINERLTSNSSLARYSYTIDSDDFTQSAQAMIDDLAEQGFRPVDLDTRPDSPGVTSHWTDGAGRTIEVDFHTPESLADASKIRDLQNEYPSADEARRDEIDAEHQRLLSRQAVPEGLDGLNLPSQDEVAGRGGDPDLPADGSGSDPSRTPEWRRQFPEPEVEQTRVDQTVSMKAPRGTPFGRLGGDLDANTCYDVKGRGKFYTNDAGEIVRVEIEKMGGNTPFSKYDGNLEPSASYEVAGRGTFHTDASGKITHVETWYGPDAGHRNVDLRYPVADATYVVERQEGSATDYRHVFETDSEARTTMAYAPDLNHDATMHRHEDSQSKVGQLGTTEKVQYNGGHLLGRIFGGGPENINLVPQLESQNQSVARVDNFRALEKSLEFLITPAPDGGRVPDVTYRVLPEYEPGSKIPTKIMVEYTVDGIKMPRRVFPNV